MPATSPRPSEKLEPRLLLASPSTAEYYPLAPTSEWEYAVTEDDGGTDTLNVRVARGTRRINKQDARRVFYDDGGGDRIETFQNINPKGKLQIHGGTFDEGELILQPGIILPSRLTPGTVKRTRGDIDFEYEGFEGDGNYTSTVRVGRERRITVPAGTFAAVRVRVDLAFEAEEDIVFGEGPEADGHITHTMWLARGVGVVRAEQRYEVEADFVIDEESREGSSVQALRSYTVAPATEAQRARSTFASEAQDERTPKRRETPDILR
jgi:hypothetical protein